MSEIIDADAVEETGTDMVVAHPGGVLIRGGSPAEFIDGAVGYANALADVVRSRGLISNIRGKEHVQVEAWTLLGSMLGVFPVVVWTRKTDDGGWEARVEARTLAGQVVGAAEAECSRSEKTWKDRDSYALRSMAQTRAVSKALRAPLGFVMTLAGFEATPAEEMPHDTTPAREFDPGVDLLEGAPHGQKFVSDGMKMLTGADPSVDWPAMVTQAITAHYGVSEAKQIPKDRFEEFARRYANMCVKVKEATSVSSFPPITDHDVQQAFAWAFGGAVVSIVRVEKQADGLPEFGT
ncbi:MAG: hypothetical protein OEV86_15115 [Candidatus Krumholzibacteria bacterium]|nr:hypothetical protein [Candidatus Krumholzibacteria bacterium]